MTSYAELLHRLESALARSPDGQSRYGSILLADESDAASMDLLVQTPSSPLPFALWYGEGVPRSTDDDGFAEDALREQLADGSVLAWLEQANNDEDGVYELVRVLVAYRSDGAVVTVNRYADPEVDPAEPSWGFGFLREVVLDARWSPQT